jgi:hypothetical protein
MPGYSPVSQRSMVTSRANRPPKSLVVRSSHLPYEMPQG